MRSTGTQSRGAKIAHQSIHMPFYSGTSCSHIPEVSRRVQSVFASNRLTIGKPVSSFDANYKKPHNTFREKWASNLARHGLLASLVTAPVFHPRLLGLGWCFRADHQHGVFRSSADGKPARQPYSISRNPVGRHFREPKQLAHASSAHCNGSRPPFQGAIL